VHIHGSKAPTDGSAVFFAGAEIVRDKSPRYAFEAANVHGAESRDRSKYLTGCIKENVFSTDRFRIREINARGDETMVTVDVIRPESVNFEPGPAAAYFLIDLKPNDGWQRAIHLRFLNWDERDGLLVPMANNKVSDLRAPFR